MHTLAHSMNSGNGTTCTHTCNHMYVKWTTLLCTLHELVSSIVHTYDFPWVVPVWIGVPYFQRPTLLPPPLGSVMSSWMRLRYYTNMKHITSCSAMINGLAHSSCIAFSALAWVMLLSWACFTSIYILYAYWESHTYVIGTMLCVD